MPERRHRLSQKKIPQSPVRTTKELIEEEGLKYSKAELCRAMDIHPKSIYKKSSKEEIVVFYKKESDHDILDQIKPVIASRSTYGF